MIALFAGAAASALVSPNGGRLHAVDQCFVIERKGHPIGLTRQIVRASRLDGRPVWDIIVHQNADAMHFDLRDHFVLARKDLQPITFDSRKDGVEDVRLSYTSGRVTGHKTGDKGQEEPVDVAFTGPTWEGNLWGITFGALPLREGAEFTLPFYQYDQGLGRFTLKATGTEIVNTPTGKVQAWVVDAGTEKSPRVTYLIDKKTGDELGTRAAGFGTRLGGDCSALD